MADSDMVLETVAGGQCQAVPHGRKHMPEGVVDHWIQIVGELSSNFAERAARKDLAGDFVAENYAELKKHRAFSAAVPAELGGGGASHAQICELLRVMAHSCPSTALALSMHQHLVAAAVSRHLHGQPAEALLLRVAEAERVLVSTGAGDWLESTGKAERADGGYRVTAEKPFGSGCPAGDLAVTSAPYDDPESGPSVLHFPVPLDASGVSIREDWNTLGMRATGSHTLVFRDVFIPEAAIVLKRPRGTWHPAFSVIVTVAPPIYTAPYVGAAEAAAEIARMHAREHPASPHLPYLVGEMENALALARMALREMIDNAAGYDFAPQVERASAALVAKTLATNAVKTVVSKAVEIVGGGAYFRRSPLERLWRDVQAAQFHPLPEKKQLLFTGRVAMGLSPV
jgi:alkylation response protein AidB-like acyl-CoA dehydrogenase